MLSRSCKDSRLSNFNQWESFSEFSLKISQICFSHFYSKKSLFWLTDAYINSPKSPFTPIRSKMWQYLVLASTWSERQNPKEALEFQTHEIPSEKANWCKNAHYFIFFTQRVILLSTLSAVYTECVIISGDTLLWDNRRILSKPIIVLTRQAQPTHE